MAGSIISKDDKGKKWLVRVFIGRDGQGRRRYAAQTVHGGRRDAEKALTALLSRRDAGGVVVKAKETVDEYLDAWLETTVKPSVRARTAYDYTNTLRRYVRPHLGAARLSRLTAVEVRAWLMTLREQELSARTVRMAHEVLRNALEQAVSDKLIPDNPARSRLVRKALPPKVRLEPVTVSSDAVAALLDVAEGDPLAAFFILQLLAGLRPSEALALRWRDVEGDTVRVTRVLVDRPGLAPHFAPPKSKTSRRAVIVPPTVTRALAAHRKRQAAARLAAGPAWQDHGLIFCDATGEALRQHVVRAGLARLVKSAGLPAAITVYALRHSCATLLLEQGIPLKVVSERLGHSTIALTADVYSHVSEGMQRQAADALETLTR